MMVRGCFRRHAGGGGAPIRLRGRRPPPSQSGLAMLDAEAIDAAVLDIILRAKELPRRRRRSPRRGVPRLFDRFYNKAAAKQLPSFPVLQKPF